MVIDRGRIRHLGSYGLLRRILRLLINNLVVIRLVFLMKVRFVNALDGLFDLVCVIVYAFVVLNGFESGPGCTDTFAVVGMLLRWIPLIIGGEPPSTFGLFTAHCSTVAKDTRDPSTILQLG